MCCPARRTSSDDGRSWHQAAGRVELKNDTDEGQKPVSQQFESEQQETIRNGSVDAALRRALGEKDALLKEVHHRVKNNMAVILSMISLQSEGFVHQETVDEMNKIAGRIRAMALAHDQLVRSKDIRSVDLGAYVQSLSDALLQTRSRRAGTVVLETRISQVAVTIDVAIPCGLILNELIGNSLEHAFPGERKGRIAVELEVCEDDRYELAVMDNGVGSQGDASSKRGRGLGLQLVELLAKQLGGELEIRWDDGADIRVRFPHQVQQPRLLE